MAYFAREDRNRSPTRKQGKLVGVRDVAPVKVVSRDELIDNQIKSMQPKDADPSAVGPMRFIRDTEDRAVVARSKHRIPDNDIFGPPVIAAQPKPRVRIGVSEDELRKIWQEDEVKFQAALKMEKGTNLVEKMAAEPINPVISSARSKDAVPPPRRHIDLLTETQQERNLQNNAPAGFAGMGSNSAQERRQGVACRQAPAQFEPPELALKPRTTGRKANFPPDTFSFNDA